MSKFPISFVVVSTPRSGTTFIADLLTRCAVPCGHELHFTPTSHAIDPLVRPGSANFLTGDNSDPTPWGDSSWMAAPFLDTLPPDTIIFHQVREPIATLNSLIHTGHMDLWNDNAYTRFARKHGLGLVPTVPAVERKQARAMAFWVYWHRLIEWEARNHKYIRYQVERLAEELPRMARALGFIITPLVERQALGQIAVTPNYSASKGPVPQIVDRENVSNEVRELAGRYGYQI